MGPTRTVILLCGPPGAGKTTEARRLAEVHDLTIFDRDDRRWASERAFTAALRRVGSDPDARAVVIRSGATTAARSRAERMVRATDTVLLAANERTCIERVKQRPGSRNQIAAVRSWWTSFRRDRGASQSRRESAITAPASRRISPLKQKAPTTSERGYGTAHQKLRKRLARTVNAGKARCARCGEPIIPGTPWDLGHIDHDRSRYAGPEHVRCNRATAGRRPKPRKRKWSRQWV